MGRNGLLFLMKLWERQLAALVRCAECALVGARTDFIQAFSRNLPGFAGICVGIRLVKRVEKR